jgi:signal recognition particle subunit SRP54
MFDILTKKLSDTFSKLTGYGKIREGNIEEAIRDVRMSLLEADVNYKVVTKLVESIKNKAVGQKVLESLTPTQHFVGIVNEELIDLFKVEENLKGLRLDSSDGISKLMLVGLQGSGKTTTAGKLAKYIYKNHGYKPLLVPCDIKRAAAQEQLKIIGDEIEIPVFLDKAIQDPVELARLALVHAKEHNFKTVIFDTAGRLHIDQELMDELSELERLLKPQEVLLVADAMTGQDAVNIAKGFEGKLDLSGIILTKMDGDARGGAALSIVSVTGKPLKFIGIGEKFDALEVFHPDRIVSRILGMGDIITLFEKTRDSIEEEEAKELAEKLSKKNFTIQDFLDQLKQVKKLGSLESIMGLIPGMSKLMKMKDLSMAEGEFSKIEAIISSMTIQERNNHAIINGRRRLRIAKGSGTAVSDVNRFLKQFLTTRKMMQRFGSINPANLLRKGMLPF